MKKLSIFRLLVISLLGFALSFSSNIQGPLQQYKTRELAPDMPNTALGALGFVGLMVAMVVQPVVGVFSDRAKTRLGRRLPFFIGGAILIAISLLLMAWAPALWVLLMAMIFTQFSSNVLQGPWQALIPDQVPESQRGTAASYKAVLDIVAFMVGGGLGGFLMGKTASWGQIAVYATALSPVVLFAIFVIITAIWAREDPNASHEVPTTTISQALKGAFYVNFKERPIFGYWFANRILFWGAYIAVTTFLTNFFIDVIGMSGDEARAFTGQLQIILGVGLIVLALVAGWLSDRFGRKLMVERAFFSGAILLFLAWRLLSEFAPWARHRRAPVVSGGATLHLTRSDWQRMLPVLEWCLANGVTPKGHPLVWPYSAGIPEWLYSVPEAAVGALTQARVVSLQARAEIWSRALDAIASLPRFEHQTFTKPAGWGDAVLVLEQSP